VQVSDSQNITNNRYEFFHLSLSNGKTLQEHIFVPKF